MHEWSRRSGLYGRHWRKLFRYPFPDLCAAGVAHKLAEALYASAGEDPSVAAEDIDIVALATVADLVPLRGENRRVVRAGLEAMSRTRRPGLRALMKVAALDPGDVDAYALAFRLAPRINAAGRLCEPEIALELLLAADAETAKPLAERLEELNRERQLIEDACRAVHTENGSVTDEVSAVERLGRKVILVPNHDLNFKIPYPRDLDRAEFVLTQRIRAAANCTGYLPAPPAKRPSDR